MAVDDMPWSGLGKANGSEGRSETGGNKVQRARRAERVVPTQVMWPGRVGLRCVARARLVTRLAKAPYHGCGGVAVGWRHVVAPRVDLLERI